MYAGGRDAFGVGGPPGLLERGEENVRMGRGRMGRTREVVELEDDEEEMTDAFRLRSASEGLWVGSSGEEAADSRVIMSGRRLMMGGKEGGKEGKGVKIGEEGT
jgi:hypothetical protein